MGVILGALIVAGGTAIIGLISSSRAETAKERIKQLKEENKQLESAKNYVSEIKTKLSSAKEYLISAKNDFKNGGHVLDEVPLANSEFTSCISKLDAAMTNATNLINDFNETIAHNKEEIKKEEAKL